MVYSIDSMHLNNGHMYPTQLMQIFSSASCVQQLIIAEQLNQIYIVAHRWKEEIFSFLTMCHSSKSVTCIKFKYFNIIAVVYRVLFKEKGSRVNPKD